MKARRYKFSNKKHPWQAQGSMILGIISLVSIITVIVFSFRQAGETKPGYGVTGLLAAIFTLAGLILGLVSFRQRESFRLLGILGCVINGLVLLSVGALFAWGLQ